jgi:F0F1-type ATP synthase delta subunit
MKLEATTSYPTDLAEVAQLYQSSEKFVRFLMNEFPKDRFVKFIDAVLEGKGMEKAVVETYPDKVKDWDAFLRRYERFTK